MAIDQYIVLAVNTLTNFDDTIVVDFIADFLDLIFFSIYIFDIGFVDFGFAVGKGVVFLLCFVGSVGAASEHTSIDGALVDDNAVFLVVPHKATDGDDGILANGQAVGHEVLGKSGVNQRFLWVV